MADQKPENKTPHKYDHEGRIDPLDPINPVDPLAWEKVTPCAAGTDSARPENYDARFADSAQSKKRGGAFVLFALIGVAILLLLLWFFGVTTDNGTEALSPPASEVGTTGTQTD